MHVRFADNRALWEPLRRWVIRVEGRPRLFESFCRETVRAITGMERFKNTDPLALVVSWMLSNRPARPQTPPNKPEQDTDWDCYPILRADSPALRGFLRRDEHGDIHGTENDPNGPYIEPDRLRHSESFQKLLRSAAVKSASPEGVGLSPLEKHALRLSEHLELFERIRAGKMEGVGGTEMEAARAALREAYQSGADDLFATALTDFLDASQRACKATATRPPSAVSPAKVGSSIRNRFSRHCISAWRRPDCWPPAGWRERGRWDSACCLFWVSSFALDLWAGRHPASSAERSCTAARRSATDRKLFSGLPRWRWVSVSCWHYCAATAFSPWPASSYPSRNLR